MGMLELSADRGVYIAHCLRAYGFGLLQDFDNVLRTIERCEIDLDEFKEFMKLAKHPRFHSVEAKQVAAKIWVSKLPRCPDGYPMQIRAVNDKESIWYCRHCAFSKYNDKPWYEALKEVSEELADDYTNAKK